MSQLQCETTPDRAADRADETPQAGGISSLAAKAKELDIDLPSNPSKVRVKLDDLLVFTRQLATMIDAGLPVDQAIETLSDQTRAPAFRAVLFVVLNEIRGGTTISAAIARYSRVFPEIYVSMVQAAEASGQLGPILNQLAGYMEASARVRQKVKSAMTYPVLATAMIMSVAAVLVLVVVPKFAQMFEMVKGELPLPTVVLLAVSNFMRNNALATLGIVVGLVAGVVVTLRTERGAYGFDMLKLKLPIFGRLFRQVAVARFSRTLSTLLSSGVPILSALHIVEKASGNRVLAEAVRNSVGGVSGGATLAEAFRSKPVFPPMLIKMIAVGEMTGRLDELLGRIADFYDERVTAAVESLTSMIEPLLIGVLGIVVGGIVIAIFFPMIKITQSI